MIERILKNSIDTQSKSILLLGPRQVGKSTLLRQLEPDLIVNLAREKEFLDHSSNPALLEELIRETKPKVVFIDEIQRIPSILNTVQAIIDEQKGPKKIKFLLSGSSARKLRRGQANLLPGRVISYALGGLSLLEIKSNIDMKKCMAFGFLPEVFLEKNSAQAMDILTSYSGIYLKEEIQAELLVRNIQGFSRFLIYFAEYSGRVLDLSKVSSKARVSRTGASRFLEILEETLLLLRCESFRDLEADTVSHPKYYFFDPGVLNGLLGGFSMTQDRVGMLFEHVVIAQIKNTAAAKHQNVELFYFRTRHGVEVDFIIRTQKKYWAIEAKTGYVTAEDAKSLEIFSHYYPKVDEQVIVVPEGSARKLNSGVRVLSLSKLISEMFE
jgi:predicted AAA+ superfamily ATPase